MPRPGVSNTRSMHLHAMLCAGMLLAVAIAAPAQTPPASASRFVVVLDAGHGGDDNGASLTASDGSTEVEKNYTLALSVRLRSLLTARGMSVVTTRESDATVDPGQRAQVANHANAEACLSLHAAMSGSGVHLFISSLPPPSAPPSFRGRPRRPPGYRIVLRSPECSTPLLRTPG